MAVQRRPRHPDRWCDLAGGHARCQELSRGLDPLGRHDLLAPTYPACATRDDERGRRSLAHEVAWLCCKDWRQSEVGCRSARSEEHTSELQSLMRISYAVFCLKKKTTQHAVADRSITMSRCNPYMDRRMSLYAK